MLLNRSSRILFPYRKHQWWPWRQTSTCQLMNLRTCSWPCKTGFSFTGFRPQRIQFRWFVWNVFLLLCCRFLRSAFIINSDSWDSVSFFVSVSWFTLPVEWRTFSSIIWTSVRPVCSSVFEGILCPPCDWVTLAQYGWVPRQEKQFRRVFTFGFECFSWCVSFFPLGTRFWYKIRALSWF